MKKLIIFLVCIMFLCGCSVLSSMSAPGYRSRSSRNLDSIAIKLNKNWELVHTEILAEADGDQSFSIERLVYKDPNGSYQIVTIVNGKIKSISPAGSFSKVGGNFKAYTIEKE